MSLWVSSFIILTVIWNINKHLTYRQWHHDFDSTNFFRCERTLLNYHYYFFNCLKFYLTLLWRHQLIFCWLSPTRKFRRTSKWFLHSFMIKNTLRKYQFFQYILLNFWLSVSWLQRARNKTERCRSNTLTYANKYLKWFMHSQI